MEASFIERGWIQKTKHVICETSIPPTTHSNQLIAMESIELKVYQRVGRPEQSYIIDRNGRELIVLSLG